MFNLLALPFLLLAADTPTGLQLQRMCNGEPGSIPHAACMFYVTGFTDGVRAAHSAQHQLHRPVACLPPDTTGEEVREATLRTLRDHPERRAIQMNAAMVLALAESYPCPRR